MVAWLKGLFLVFVGVVAGVVGTSVLTLAFAVVVIDAQTDGMADAGCLGREMTEAETLSTARHESGHTVVALALEPGWYERTDVYPKGTPIDGSDCASGVTTVNFPAQLTRVQMVEAIAIEYGGYAADLELNGELDTGASRDITIATARAVMMIDTYGMGRRVPPYDIQLLSQNGFALGSAVDAARAEEVQEALDQGLTLAQLIVRQNRARAERIAHALLDSPFYGLDVYGIALTDEADPTEEDVSLPTE